MTVYMIAQINISDRTRYSQYEEGFFDIFAKYKGEMMSVDEATVVVEGDWAYDRTVLISFPSAEDAMAWYECNEYQTLAKHRFAASVANLVMIDAFVPGSYRF